MGQGACDTAGRIAASLGTLEAVAPDFQAALDVPNGGVLFALPALLAMGLLATTDRYFSLPRGYYGLDSLFLLLAFMALARLKSIESLRYCAPGEWGKWLGLDRVPEVRTLRQKLRQLACDDQPSQWGAELCRQWMEAVPEQAATLYLDGHVRVYHGHQTTLPRHYVARQKLCLRATTDYWVNAMDGQPFLVVHKPIDPGLIQVLEQDILPELLQTVPNQPDADALQADPLLHRFTLVFDREGYSPDLLKRLKQQRVACLTYHKYPGENWPAEEFQPCQVRLVHGQTVTMQLAERGTRLSNGLWLRELRKLTERGHQTAILATDYRSPLAPLAAAMFARWSQENYFKYARQNYSLDRLVDYGIEPISDPIPVINPAYRRLEGQIRSATGQLNRLLAQFGALNLEQPIESDTVEDFIRRKAVLQEAIDLLQHQIQTAKAERQATPRHIAVSDLPQPDRFQQLSTQSKHLIDTLKMVAYRAETAMAAILREHLAHPDQARSLLQALYRTEADLLPDLEAGTLTVRLHHLANASSDAAIHQLCEALNETETVFPRTPLKLILKLGSG
jgi:hypothetical protein